MITLKPIKESPEDFEAVERKIVELFKREIYLPLLLELEAPKNVLKNSMEDLLEAIQTGRISFYRGTFSGRFNSSVSKELKGLGARWDQKTGTFKIPQSSLPYDLRAAITASSDKFQRRIEKIDQKLAKILPDEVASRLSVAKNFDTTLWKTDRDFRASVKGITIAPELTKEQRAKVADEWQNNMKLWIKDFTEKEIKSLRKDIQKSVLTGNRYESAISKIQKSFDVSQNKAKFLARQETSLLMTKFKETRYEDAGVREYKWACVGGSKNHPVRPWHKALEGKVFRWDAPPVTTKPGEPIRRNNPGQDYNCRCFAIPIVRFKK